MFHAENFRQKLAIYCSGLHFLNGSHLFDDMGVRTIIGQGLKQIKKKKGKTRRRTLKVRNHLRETHSFLAYIIIFFNDKFCRHIQRLKIVAPRIAFEKMKTTPLTSNKWHCKVERDAKLIPYLRWFSQNAFRKFNS